MEGAAAGRSACALSRRHRIKAGILSPERRQEAIEAMEAWPKVGLLSPCGHGNLGDAAIQQAVIAELRSRYPHADIIGITLVPADTFRRHGIRTIPLGGASPLHYGIVPNGAGSAGDLRSDSANGTTGSRSRSGLSDFLARGVLGAMRKLLPKGMPWAIRQDLLHWKLAWSTVRDLDWLVVSGGGQIDDFWGGPWGHPWAMFKWSLLARLAGCRVLIVSVGAGTTDAALSRFLIRQALRLAHYRSFRDEGSRDIVRRIGFFRDDPVQPDLAYGLSAPRVNEQSLPRSQARRRIAIAPMAYARPGIWPAADAERYDRYIQKLSELSVRLLEDGYAVSLIHSDGPDTKAVTDVHERVTRVIPGACCERFECPHTTQVGQFLAACQGADMIVASRLHGVILSHVIGTPVIALSYDRKVRVAMQETAQEEECLDIDGFSVTEAYRAIRAMLVRHEEHRATVESHVRAFQVRLAQQYDEIFPGVSSAHTM